MSGAPALLAVVVAALSWSVMLMVCWLSCGAARSRWVLLPPLAAQATKWARLGVPFTLQLPYTIMIIACIGA